jgi:NADH:ubiquinone oxidoreductase subunit 5 (subunit L)/multisubunit Na+/H+ antiporter MnhA subunit
MSYEQNILRMGGLNSIIPKVNYALWISFAACVGIPFFVGFFAKISFMNAIRFSGRFHLEVCNIIVNIVSMAAVFRVILISMYGKSRTSKSTLSRAQDFNSESILPIWILLGFATFGSFICHILYESGKLHFGYGGMNFIIGSFDHFVETVIESAQIVIAILMVLFFSKLSILKKNDKLRYYLLFLFKSNFIYNALIKLIKNFLYYVFDAFNKLNDNLNILLNYKSFRIIYAIGNIIQDKHKCSLYNHLLWILTGITVNLICYILWRTR